MLYKLLVGSVLLVGKAVATPWNETETTEAPIVTTTTSLPTTTIALDGGDAIINVEVALIGAEVVNQCKGDGFKKSFRKKYQDSLLAMYVDACGLTEEQVLDKYVDGCHSLDVTESRRRRRLADDYDTAVYGSNGIVATFKLSSDEAQVINKFTGRFQSGAFNEDFDDQLALIFDAVITDNENTVRTDAGAGKNSRSSSSKSDAKKMASIWLLPGLVLMISSFGFMYMTMSVIDPTGVEEFDRMERLKVERIQFEKEFGALDLDAAAGDLIKHDLPANEATLAVEIQGADGRTTTVKKVVHTTSTTASVTSAAGESKPGKKEEVKDDSDDGVVLPGVATQTAETGGETVTSAAAVPKEKEDDARVAAELETKKKVEEPPKKEEAVAEEPVDDIGEGPGVGLPPKDEEVAEEVVAEEPEVEDVKVVAEAPAQAMGSLEDDDTSEVSAEAPEEEEEEAVEQPPEAEELPTYDEAPQTDEAPLVESASAAPASVVSAMVHKPQQSESFDPTKFGTKQEAEEATKVYLDDLWDAGGDDDDALLEDSDETSSESL